MQKPVPQPRLSFRNYRKQNPDRSERGGLKAGTEAAAHRGGAPGTHLRRLRVASGGAGEGGPVAWSWGLRGTLGSDFIQGAPENQTQA